MKKRRRKFILMIGAMQSGKSYQAEQIAKSYPGAVVVYNAGKPEDFKGFEPGEILPKEKAAMYVAKEERKGYEYRADFYAVGTIGRGSVYFTQNIPDEGRKLKVYRAGRTDTERAFFAAALAYFANTLVILDDCKAVFRYGASAEAIDFLSRINHAGNLRRDNRRGADVIAIFHGLDKVNPVFFDYCTDIVLFKTNSQPEDASFNNPDLMQVIQSAFDYLKPFTLEERRYCIIDTNTLTIKKN